MRRAQPRILVFQHMSLAHAGIFRACMRAAGMAWDVVALEAGEPIPTLADYDALLVMGGAMDVWQEAQHPWLRAEKQAIRAAVLEHGMAYLGICLGHQLLADALGGEVREAATPEVGIREVRLNAAGRSSPLFQGLPERSRWLQWHAAEVVTAPAGAEVLAYSDACAVQALAVGARAFGLQFHAEVDLPTLADWLADAETRAALVRHRGADGPERLRAEAAAAMPALEGAARQIFDNFRALLRARAR